MVHKSYAAECAHGVTRSNRHTHMQVPASTSPRLMSTGAVFHVVTWLSPAAPEGAQEGLAL